MTANDATTVSLLKQSILFQGMDDSTFDSVIENLQWVHLNSGDLLFSQDDPGQDLFVVVHGRLRVFIRDEAGGAQRPVREIGVGETVGEIGLITNEARSATVSAVRDTDLLRFSKQAFEHLVQQHPASMLHQTRLMAMRLRDNRLQDTHREFSTLALVPTRDGLPLDLMIETIERELGKSGPTLCITASRLDQALGAGSAQSRREESGHKRISAWLSTQEDAHRFMVLIAENNDSEWSRRCVRHADRVLFVARSADKPASHPINDYIETHRDSLSKPIMELLLLQEPGRKPSGTAAWLDSLTVDQHYHVNLDNCASSERLARLLTGNATSLVLGGGGARGFAHIGVLKALRETGQVELDAIGGTSMGSIIGAQIAMGWSLEEMMERNRQGFVRSGKLHDLTLPLVSLLRGHHGDRILQQLFGDIQIEDLETNFFAVSTNLTRGNIVVHRRGNLFKAIRASISVPGILPPVFDAGEVLVDGGVLNNLPVDVMQELHRTQVIAVDVSPVEDISTRPDFEQCPSAMEILWQQINPRSATHKVPKIFDILMRSGTLASTRAAQEMANQVGLFLHPPTEEFGMTEWESFERLVEVGYASSKAPIAAWLNQNETD